MGNAARKMELEITSERFQRTAIILPKEDEASRLKKFGFVMGLVCAIFGALGLWRHTRFGVPLTVISCLFTFAAIIRPTALAPVEKGWMAFGERMSRVMTFLLLTLAYFIVITPMGFLVRLLGKDLLHLKLDPKLKSYWEPVEENGPSTRPFKPY